jgi:hypothetical protein
MPAPNVPAAYGQYFGLVFFIDIECRDTTASNPASVFASSFPYFFAQKVSLYQNWTVGRSLTGRCSVHIRQGRTQGVLPGCNPPNSPKTESSITQILLPGLQPPKPPKNQNLSNSDLVVRAAAPQTPQNQNLWNSDFVGSMTSKILRDFRFQPKSATEIG